MVDSDALREDIKRSGYRMDFIADKLNMGYQTLFNKIDNKSEFTVSEVQAYCELTGQSIPDVIHIFFRGVN